MAENLKEQVERLEKELSELKERNMFENLSSNEVESLKKVIFERTATNVSGSADRYLVVDFNGKRSAMAGYTNFTPVE